MSEMRMAATGFAAQTEKSAPMKEQARVLSPAGGKSEGMVLSGGQKDGLVLSGGAKDEPILSGGQQDGTMSGQQQEGPTFSGKRRGKKHEEPDFFQNKLEVSGDNIADFLINEVMSGDIFLKLHQQVTDKLKLVPYFNGQNNFSKLKSCMSDFLKGYVDEDGQYHEGLRDAKDNMIRDWKKAFAKGLGPKGLETNNGKDAPKKEKDGSKKEKKKTEKKKEKPHKEKEATKKKKEKPEDIKKRTEAYNKNEQTKSNISKNGKRMVNGTRKSVMG